MGGSIYGSTGTIHNDNLSSSQRSSGEESPAWDLGTAWSGTSWDDVPLQLVIRPSLDNEPLLAGDGRQASRSCCSPALLPVPVELDLRLDEAGDASTALMLSDMVRKVVRARFVVFLIWVAAMASFLDTNSLRVGGFQFPLCSANAMRMKAMTTTIPRETRVRVLVL